MYHYHSVWGERTIHLRLAVDPPYSCAPVSALVFVPSQLAGVLFGLGRRGERTEGALLSDSRQESLAFCSSLLEFAVCPAQENHFCSCAIVAASATVHVQVFLFCTYQCSKLCLWVCFLAHLASLLSLNEV